ncbi:NACHT domain-containing protein [Nocardia amikacinitolerans]|uniref:NACHT domain-containing protein n=1 Tax=Nocardia amikacinitolerans TaxID=756689 RepID=UPI003679740A
MIESGSVSELTAYFESLHPKVRRLTILGDPGSGKTVAAKQLVLGLLETRRGMVDAVRRQQPVPVRVNATGWDGAIPFTLWLSTRLIWDYPHLRPVVAKHLVEQNHILPVIDGLDEMDTLENRGEFARALLNQLNSTPWEQRSVVVVCRTSRFRELCRQGEDNGLHRSATATIRPLTHKVIRKKLNDSSAATGSTRLGWSAVNTHLVEHKYGPLATVLRSPLMLTLAVNAMHPPVPISRPSDKKIGEELVACTATSEVENVLFARLIPAAISTIDNPYYDSDEVRNWLRSLASHLERRRGTRQDGAAIRLDEIWEIAGVNRCRIVHGLAACLVTSVAIGLTGAAGFGPRVGLAAGLVAGLTAGLSSSRRVVSTRRINVRRKHREPRRSHGRSRWSRMLTEGVFTALAAGLAAGGAVWWTSGAAAGISFVLIFVGLVVLPSGLAIAVTVDRGHDTPVVLDEKRPIRDDLRAGLLLRGSMGLGAGVAVGVAGGLSGGVVVGLAIVLASSFLGGLAGERYFIATLIFRFTKDFAPRPMVLMDRAREKGLLRVNVTAYQFVHETYRNWLLNLPNQQLRP